MEKVYNTDSPFVTILHGDCWLNNMFFRKDENGETRLKMIDFGMMHRYQIALLRLGKLSKMLPL